MTLEELKNILPIECRLRFASGKLHIGGIARSINGRYQDIYLLTDSGEPAESLFDTIEALDEKLERVENERDNLLNAVERVLIAHVSGDGLEAELNKLKVASLL